MHYADMNKSKRLQRLAALLSDGCKHTTRDIIQNAGICAVNSAVSELRRNGISVGCALSGITSEGNRVYEYWLDSDPVLVL